MPDAHVATLTHAPTMLTTDLALRFDPVYEPISRRFLEHPDELADAFARAWFKLTHRDMGPARAVPRARGTERGAAVAGPAPRGDARAHRGAGHRRPQGPDPRLGSVRLAARPTAWASASSFRGSDKRGGANGARIRLEPQNGWEVNDPAELATVLRTLEGIQESFNGSQNGGGKQVSLADLIVLGGCAAVEQAAKNAGHDVEVPFTPGRADASQEQTDAESFAALEPTADGFRNYLAEDHRLTAEYLLVDKANLLTLSAPEMTVLVGGLRVLGANSGGSPAGVLTETPGVAHERLLREPARPGHDVDGDVRRRGEVRGAQRHGRGQVDRHPRRPRVRLELRAARARRGLRER